MRIFRSVAVIFLFFVSIVSFAQNSFRLEKVTIISRHSVRAPLETYLNTLDEMTGNGHQWTRWSVPGSYLTLRGGASEMLFGEYYRLWLDNEHFAAYHCHCPGFRCGHAAPHYRTY